MKRRFYLTLLLLAVILIALPGLTAKGARRVARYPCRVARRLPASLGSALAGGFGS
jgi:hypothetical protein